MLGVAPSTLRYWEKEFPECRPIRNPGNRRYYTPANIRTLQKINFLVRVKGLRIDAAKAELHSNEKNVSRRFEAIDLLEQTRDELRGLLEALKKRR